MYFNGASTACSLKLCLTRARTVRKKQKDLARGNRSHKCRNCSDLVLKIGKPTTRELPPRNFYSSPGRPVNGRFVMPCPLEEISLWNLVVENHRPCVKTTRAALIESMSISRIIS